MGYNKQKEAIDPEHAGNREEGKPKDINDPFYGTGSASSNIPPGQETGVNIDPSVKKDYDASKNAGGSKSSTEKPEQ